MTCADLLPTSAADDFAQRILALHGATFTDAALPPQPVPSARDLFGTCCSVPPLATEPIYRAALAACSALGFIAADAHTLAKAWLRQSLRTGRADPAQWPGDPRDFALPPPPVAHDTSGCAPAFASCPSSLGLYAVLPDAAWVGRMARAGVPTVQLRFKSTDARAIRAEVAAAVQAVRGTGALLFINDHWQVAIEAGAYGVHLGQEDLQSLPAHALPALRNAGLRLGISTHGYAEMCKAAAVRPSYLALGAVFPTTLKRMATAAQGLARLRAYAALLRGWPLVAIGGIAAEQLADVLASGVGSVAVVRAIVNAENPEAAAANLMARMKPA